MKRHTTGIKRILLLALLCASVCAWVFTGLSIFKASVSAAAAPGTINVFGRVFQDYNGNGVYDTSGSAALPAIDAGIAGVTVTAYDPGNIARGTATTLAGTAPARGSYNLTVTGTGPYRIEFTNLPAGYFPSASSVDSDAIATTPISMMSAGTAVQFIPEKSIEGINLGLNHPSDYCQNNPDICVNQFFNGDSNDTTGSPTTIWRLPYSIPQGDFPTGPQTPIATKTQVGSTWGLAYSKKTKKVYSAAFLKRHVGLKNGLGDIYANGAPFVNISNPGTIGTNIARGLGAPGVRNNDPTTFGQIGKIGLGDIDISEDDSLLYAVNLNDKKLYKVQMDSDNNPATNPSAADITGYQIPDPQCAKTSTPGAQAGGVWRPFGVGVYRGNVYVGGVCDASISQSKLDLRAVIYKFDPVPNTFTQVLTFSLDYPKGFVFSTCGNTSTGWYPWQDTPPPANNCAGRMIYPQPILSDITFDNDGSMIIGFMDRMGHQEGANNYGTTGTTVFQTMVGGDILRAYNNAGIFVLEKNGQAGSLNGTGIGNGQGPGGGEFYAGDFYSTAHAETSEGGLAMLPGANSVVMTAMDPANKVNTGGAAWLYNSAVNTTGKNKGYSIYPDSNSVEFFGKSNGIGDVELMCDLAPIEIGNRLWKDTDGDGIQDPGEPGIAKVTVRLYKGNLPVTGATAVTDANGEYYFSSAAGTSTGNRIFNLAVLPNTAYQIRVDNPADRALAGDPLFGLGSTVQNAGSNDSIDSDATDVSGPAGSPSGTFPVISLTTGAAGANDHTFDVGFGLPREPKNCCGTGKNLVKNGDFSGGPKGFDTKFELAEILTPGDFLVGNSENALENCKNWDVNGHTNCEEKENNFMMVNGLTNQTTGNHLVWSQNVQVPATKTEQTYQFCAWFKDLKQCCFNQKPKITMQAQTQGVNAAQTTTISTGNKRCDWQLVSTEVHVPAGVTNVNLQILLDENADGDGNDVAIDDISLATVDALATNETQFNFAGTWISPTQYNLQTTPVKPFKPDCKYTWSAVKLGKSDMTPDPATLQTWTAPSGAFNFNGYPSSTAGPNGLFDIDETYEISLRVECDCAKPQTSRMRIYLSPPSASRIANPPARGAAIPAQLFKVQLVTDVKPPRQ